MSLYAPWLSGIPSPDSVGTQKPRRVAKLQGPVRGNIDNNNCILLTSQGMCCKDANLTHSPMSYIRCGGPAGEQGSEGHRLQSRERDRSTPFTGSGIISRHISLTLPANNGSFRSRTSQLASRGQWREVSSDRLSSVTEKHKSRGDEVETLQQSAVSSPRK
jgi:hypothetical protein